MNVNNHMKIEVSDVEKRILRIGSILGAIGALSGAALWGMGVFQDHAIRPVVEEASQELSVMIDKNGDMIEYNGREDARRALDSTEWFLDRAAIDLYRLDQRIADQGGTATEEQARAKTALERKINRYQLESSQLREVLRPDISRSATRERSK